MDSYFQGGWDYIREVFVCNADGWVDKVRQEFLWTMFADDIVICNESRKQVEERLESWRYAFERRGMKSVEARDNTCV